MKEFLKESFSWLREAQRNWYLKLGCFLIGYQYQTLAGCSELSKMKVRKYSSILFLILAIWFFTGYSFANLYINPDAQKSSFLPLISGFIAVFFILSFERSILLDLQNSKGKLKLRIFLGFIFSILSSVVIDQIIFQEDIKLKKEELRPEWINTIYDNQKVAIDKEISKNQKIIDSLGTKIKEYRDKINAKGSKFVQKYDLRDEKRFKTATGEDTIVKNNRQELVELDNPNVGFLKTEEENQKKIVAINQALKDSLLNKVKPAIEQKIKDHHGFLEELKVMNEVLSSSRYALAFWLLMFFGLIVIEMLIVASKWNETKENLSDFEELLIHQSEMHKKRIELLRKQRETLSPDSKN